jgi:hypothetical protein
MISSPILRGPELGLHPAGPLRSRRRLPRLQKAAQARGLPAGPTERGGPPPLSNSPRDYAVSSGLSSKLRTA